MVNKLIMPQLPNRNQIKRGMKVFVELKNDQGTDKLTEGLVKEILTSGNSHPHGIKVELQSGQVGRVKEIVSGPKDSAEILDDKITIPENEDKKNEFKATLKFDLKRFEQGDGAKVGNKSVLNEIPITVSGFANNLGGNLFLGIRDDGEILGLDYDFGMLGGRDKFEQEITNALRQIDDQAFVSKLTILYQEIKGKTICVIKVHPSKKPIFVRNGEFNELHVRMHNTTKKFDGKEIADYLVQHF